ncbi:MAG: hypothetical protein ACTS3R_15400 [Inquilinaceae bacterium]
MDETLPQPKLFGRAGVLADFAAALSGGPTEDHFRSGADKLRSLALAHAAVRSWRERRPVALQEFASAWADPARVLTTAK